MSRVLQFGKEKAKVAGLKLASSAETAHSTEFYRQAKNLKSVSVSEQRNIRVTGKNVSHNAATPKPQVERGIGVRLLTAEEAAVFLRVSYSTLAHWRKSDKGPRVTRIGRIVRYREVDLTAFLEGSNGAIIV